MIQLPGVEEGSSPRKRIVAKENGASRDWILVVVVSRAGLCGVCVWLVCGSSVAYVLLVWCLWVVCVTCV